MCLFVSVCTTCRPVAIIGGACDFRIMVWHVRSIRIVLIFVKKILDRPVRRKRALKSREKGYNSPYFQPQDDSDPGYYVRAEFFLGILIFPLLMVMGK